MPVDHTNTLTCTFCVTSAPKDLPFDDAPANVFENSLTPSHCFDTVHPPPCTVARPRRSAADRAENILAGGGGALALLSSVPSSCFSQSTFVDKRPAGPFEVPSLDLSPLSRPTPSVLRLLPLPFVHQLQRRGLRGLFALECMSGITSPPPALYLPLSFFAAV